MSKILLILSLICNFYFFSLVASDYKDTRRMFNELEDARSEICSIEWWWGEGGFIGECKTIEISYE